MNSILKWIEQWFGSQCDGYWEHSFTIRIETLDNPGWDIKIDLTDTTLEELSIPYKLVKRSDNDWYGIKAENKVFEAFGDPFKLEFLLNEFKELVEQHKSKNLAN